MERLPMDNFDLEQNLNFDNIQDMCLI